jgi:hypothetical protein
MTTRRGGRPKSGSPRLCETEESMIKLKDQRPDYPIGTLVEILKPFWHLREGHTGVAVEHYEDGRVLFKFGNDHLAFSVDDLEYFLRIIPIGAPRKPEDTIASLRTQREALADALRPFAGEAKMLRDWQLEGAFGGSGKYHTLEEYEHVDAALAAYEVEVG